eukprot:gnl/MRDRNA2_/MRDRNA2_60445_c0_seq1.p1 gnl/MRDRNA2_/MRDRNA2_60445_c0~~gnl/MRDRNA2_/MRDRNA2_60445_c0_seq1.p1  ORF type:complete len:126 (+),score=24.77 gnl/MRDRNA2_/MRDRNA2_60445_c0_seq1:44-379(+)
MHPGLKAQQGGAPWENGVHGNTWPLKLEGAVGSWPMFGAGPRSCPASEQSLIFLAASIAGIVRDFRWEVADVPKGDVSWAFAYAEDGSLLVPAVDTKIKFTRRNPQQVQSL